MFKIGIIGVGNMGEAILKGLLSRVSPDEIIVSDASQERLDFIINKYGVAGTDNNKRLASLSDIVFLVVKPKDVEKVLSQIGKELRGKILVSSVAGLKINKIKQFTDINVARIMPNTPAMVGESATGIAFDENFPEEKKGEIINLISSFGKAVVVDENLMDAITGLSGSGPAYILTVIDGLAQAGVKQGLSYQQALDLATQTVLGTAKLLQETKEHPAVLRDKVTSPGGTTIHGLHELEKGKIKDSLINAVEAATKRSKELSGE